MPPLADFVCRGPKCRAADGAAPTYELPIGATRCAVCGSKRITRLFNRVAVIGTRPLPPPSDGRLTSSSHFVRSTALMEPGFQHAEQHRAPRNMRSYVATGAEAATWAAAVGGALGKGRPMSPMEIARARHQDVFSVPSVLHAINRSGVPTIAKRDPRGEG